MYVSCVAGRARILSYGTTKDKMLLIEDCPNSNAVTILVRGGSKMIIDEAKRSLHDAICVTRSLIKDSRIVYGGGSSDLACSIAVLEAADKEPSIEQYAMRAFADALENIPIALAENSGLNPIETVAKVKADQVATGNPHIGVNCNQMDTADMKEQKVFDPYLSKRYVMNNHGVHGIDNSICWQHSWSA